MTPGDADVLLRWRNDQEARRWSRSQQVIAPRDHLEWLTAAVADPRRRYLLVLDGATPVASVRYDVAVDSPDTAQVSVLVAPAARGRGVGARALRLGQADLEASLPGVRCVVAVVHEQNLASRHLFEQADYRLDSADREWLTYSRAASQRGVSHRTDDPEARGTSARYRWGAGDNDRTER